MRKTVFVLGAGASRDYKFPTTEELLQTIGGYKYVEIPRERDLRIIRNLYAAMSFLFPEDKIVSFSEKLLGSKLPSVDTFMNSPKFDEKEHDLIGRYFIALAIIVKESSKEPITTDWYQLFLSYIYKNWQHFIEGRIQIVTFNYDRSLENYLYTGLGYSMRETGNELLNYINNNIHHVYGSLGNYQVNGSIEYGWWNTIVGKKLSYAQTDDFKVKISNAANNLFIINDRRQVENKERPNAQKAIAESDEIYFLGFGYDIDNLKILNFYDQLPRLNADVCKGTAFKSNTEKRLSLYRDVLNNQFGDYGLAEKVFYNKDCFEFFRDFF